MKHLPYTKSTRRWAALLLVMSVLLGGCGQTGPLYLPEDDQKKTQ